MGHRHKLTSDSTLAEGKVDIGLVKRGKMVQSTSATMAHDG